jgi:hypothetical protein
VSLLVAELLGLVKAEDMGEWDEDSLIGLVSKVLIHSIHADAD